MVLLFLLNTSVHFVLLVIAILLSILFFWIFRFAPCILIFSSWAVQSGLSRGSPSILLRTLFASVSLLGFKNFLRSVIFVGVYPSTWSEEFLMIRHVCGHLDLSIHFFGYVYSFHLLEILLPLCGLGPLYLSMLDFRLSSSWDDPSTLWTLVCIRPFWTSNSHALGIICPFCGIALHPSILDFRFSSSWDDSSTSWTCFVSVNFGLQILILLGWSFHFVDLFYICPFWTSDSHPLVHPLCGFVLYPSILDFKFSFSWDDPST